MEPTGKQEVTPLRYSEIAIPHMKDNVIMPFEAWEMGLLHGVIRIALSVLRPGALTDTSMQAIDRWRKFCCTVIGSWGFSPEEVAWLDSAEVDDNGRVIRTEGVRLGGLVNMPETAREMLAFADARARYPSGIGKIDRGECPRGMANAAACTFCSYGHMLECHYPKTCREAGCSHYDVERN